MRAGDAFKRSRWRVKDVSMDLARVARASCCCAASAQQVYNSEKLDAVIYRALAYDQLKHAHYPKFSLSKVLHNS